MFDSRQYETGFSNGDIEVPITNFISKDLLAQVDKECNRQLIYDYITDHCILYNHISKPEGTYVTRNGMQINKRTMKFWDICVLRKYKSRYWIPIECLKGFYPVKLVEFVVT